MQHPRVTFQAKATLSPFPFICREGLVQRLAHLGSLEGVDVLGFLVKERGKAALSDITIEREQKGRTP